MKCTEYQTSIQGYYLICRYRDSNTRVCILIVVDMNEMILNCSIKIGHSSRLEKWTSTLLKHTETANILFNAKSLSPRSTAILHARLKSWKSPSVRSLVNNIHLKNISRCYPHPTHSKRSTVLITAEQFHIVLTAELSSRVRAKGKKLTQMRCCNAAVKQRGRVSRHHFVQLGSHIGDSWKGWKRDDWAKSLKLAWVRGRLYSANIDLNDFRFAHSEVRRLMQYLAWQMLRRPFLLLWNDRG